MEDKLVKTNHGYFYYYFKKISTLFGIFMCVSVVVAIPVSIAATLKAQKEAQEERVAKESLDKVNEEANNLLRF